MKPINRPNPKVRVEKNDRYESKDGSDELTIVAFPESTWNMVISVSEKMGISTAELLSIAIKEFSERNDT